MCIVSVAKSRRSVVFIYYKYYRSTAPKAVSMVPTRATTSAYNASTAVIMLSSGTLLSPWQCSLGIYAVSTAVLIRQYVGWITRACTVHLVGVTVVSLLYHANIMLLCCYCDATVLLYHATVSLISCIPSSFANCLPSAIYTTSCYITSSQINRTTPDQSPKQQHQ